MPDREVKIGLATYVDENGLGGRYGFQGETVKVHADDVGRFDELNEQPGGDQPYDPVKASEESLAAHEPGAAPKKRAVGKRS